MKFSCESYTDVEYMMGALVVSDSEEEIWYWLRFDLRTEKCYAFMQKNDENGPETEMSWAAGLVILQGTKSQIPEELYDLA